METAMCGICGVINTSNEKIPGVVSMVDAMSSLIAHRGPDGKGEWFHQNGALGFGHRRLSIIDLVTGSQPMTDDSGN